MNEADLLQKLKTVNRMPDLDAMRLEVVQAMQADGTKETFERVQQAFRSAKNRIRRIPLAQRDW